MLLPDFERLFESYTKDGAKISKTFGWLLRESGAGEAIVMRVLSATMLEVSTGREWPTDGCKCGCETNLAHAAIEHHMLRECKRLKKLEDETKYKNLEQMLQKMVLTHIQEDNIAFEQEEKAKWPEMTRTQRVKKWIGLG